MTSLHRLTVWRKADLLAQRICATITSDPAAPHADLVMRLRAAATDVPLLIDAGSRAAEASGFAGQIDRAIDLTHKVRYLLSLSESLGRLASSECARLHARTDQVQRMLTGLLRTVEQRPRASAKIRPSRETNGHATTRRRSPSSPSGPGD
ncbi:MAG: four helix bundle protein [Gemmatimonadaceae bacterium]